MRRREQDGFTLVELLVTLAILGALATIALRSVQGIEDRTRYETTVHRLEDIRTALLGPSRTLPTQSSAGGLLADTGRFLDEAVTDPSMRLRDLLQQPPGVASSALRTAPDHPDIKLAVGWRGPYLMLPPGSSSEVVEDGWGNPIVALLDAGTGCWSLVSSGQDGVVGSGAGYDADISLVLPRDANTATLSGSVLITWTTGSPQNPTIEVVLFEPDAATGLVSDLHYPSTAPETATGLTTFAFQFPLGAGATPGPRVVRAYLSGTNPQPPGGSLVVTSRAVSIDLLSGAQTLNLEISGP